MCLSIIHRFRQWYSCIFPKLGKWWDYALYVLAILTFWAMCKDINFWLQKRAGNWLTALASYLAENDFLCWLLVMAIVAYTVYVCFKKARDQYRSASELLLTIAVILVLAASSGYWEYVRIAGPISFLHLIILALTAVGCTNLYIPERMQVAVSDQPQKRFTVDNVKAAVGDADKNRVAYAKNLVERILNTDMQAEAFSVGISGQWGSGKSTFLEVLKQAFEEDKSGRVSVVVEFHPWDGASSGQIVTDFFNVLVGKLGKEYSVLRGPLLKYAELLMAIDAKKPVLYFAEQLDKRRKKSIGEAKTLISDYLRRYNKIVPVLIDDLDRLTADEIADMLKLIRDTADFPNIVYIAAYDKGYVCEQLEKRRSIESPSIYMEKFFSVEFVLPKLDDQYQYEVLAAEIKAMNPNKELLRMIEDMPGGIKRLLCKHFGNFRQVKRFARIFVHDCEYFLQRPDAMRIIELRDLFLLKMLAFLDIDTYLLLEKKSSTLIVPSSKVWSGFKPLELRPGVVKEAVSEENKKKAYGGEPLSEATKEILEWLFRQPRGGCKKTCFINPESAPIYFMLNIPSRTIPILEVNRLIGGEDDIEKKFSQWAEEEKLSSLYNHLIGINSEKMTLGQAKRYLYLCLSIFPYLVISAREMAEHALRSNHYNRALYDELKKYVSEQIEKLIEKAGDDLFEGYNRLMKSFTLLYYEQAEAEYKNEEGCATLLGTTSDIVDVASKTFLAFANRTGRDADDVLREDSLTRSIVEDAVVSFHDDEGEWQGCRSLIADAMLDYFREHKGKKREFAVHYFDIDDDTPVEYEDDTRDGKYYDLLHIFGSEETYNKFVAECFEDDKNKSKSD